MCLPAVHPMDGRTASQPAISPGCARCRASKIALNNGSPHPICKNVILKTIIPLRHGDSFVLPSNAFFSTHSQVALLVDASNAFNNLNCQLALANISTICPVFSRILINTYRNDAKLFV